MSEITEKILVGALELPPIERAELIEQLLDIEFLSIADVELTEAIQLFAALTIADRFCKF